MYRSLRVTNDTAMRILAPSINDATEKINSFLVKFFGVCLLLRFGINFWAFGDEDTISPTLVTNVRGTAAENMDRIQGMDGQRHSPRSIAIMKFFCSH